LLVAVVRDGLVVAVAAQLKAELLQLLLLVHIMLQLEQVADHLLMDLSVLLME
jgi:hypothetical protein